MEDHVRAVFRHHVTHAMAIEHVGDANVDLPFFCHRAQLAFEKKLGRLGPIDQDYALRRELEQLAADLGTDAAGTAGNQDHAPVDPLANVIVVKLNRLALQKVFDRDGPGLNGNAAFNQLAVIGHDADLAAAVPRVVD
jgi:hypothetical protein